MQVLSLLDLFDPDCMGGAARVFYEINSELNKRKNSVHVICRRLTNEKIDSSDGITYHTYPEIEEGQLKKISYYKQSIRKLFCNYLKDNNPDLILIHSSSAAIGLAKILKKSSIPVIYYFHSPWHKEYELLTGKKVCGIQCPLVTTFSAIRKHHERKYLNIASGIVTLSSSMQQIMLQSHPGLQKTPMLINPGAADKNLFYPIKPSLSTDEFKKQKCKIRKKLNISPNDFIIISSRRLVPRTGVDVLIKAFSLLSKQTTSKTIKLILTGDGSSREELQQLVRALKLTKDVTFTGYVEEKALADYYRCSDLFVMPTKQLEGFGLSTVEAMASGLPLLGTNIGGTPEILNKISDQLIIAECSPEAIADKIFKFITKEELSKWREQSIKCSDTYFSWTKHSDNLINFYKALPQ